MKNIQFKDGVVKDGEYKGCRCSLMIKDEKLTLNIFGNEKQAQMKFDNIEQMNKTIKIEWDDITKEKELAFEVAKWWKENFPDSKFSDMIIEQIEDWNTDDGFSPYVLFGISGAVQPYYDEKINDKAELKKFLDVFSKFYDEFFDKYQHGECNDLEDYVATELFEWIIGTEKSRLVYEALIPGKLKDYCKEYFAF